MAYTTADNNYSTTRYIVGASGKANYLTIASAITAASADGGGTVFIMPGIYTENLTLQPSVNLASFDTDALTPTVTISGKCTFTQAGSVSISGIRLQTNSDFLLAVTGTVASVVNLKDCYLNISNNTGISFTSTSASSAINITDCNGNIGTTGIAFIAHSATGALTVNNGYFTNSGLSTTASTLSGTGSWQMYYTFFTNPVTTSATLNGFTFFKCFLSTSSTNTTTITHGCTNASGPSLIDCWLASGTASTISISASCNLILTNSTVQSNNTNVVTGAGTISYTSVKFTGSSNVMNTTTQSASYTNHGKWKASNQPCFLAYLASTDANVTGDNTTFTVGSATALTEVFDLDSNFSTATFTAPVTGKYLLIANILAQQATTAMTGQININTSNANYQFCNTAAETGNNGWSCSVVCDMDAADTAVMQTIFSGATKVVDAYGAASDRRTSFSGLLVA